MTKPQYLRIQKNPSLSPVNSPTTKSTVHQQNINGKGIGGRFCGFWYGGLWVFEQGGEVDLEESGTLGCGLTGWAGGFDNSGIHIRLCVYYVDGNNLPINSPIRILNMSLAAFLL